MFKSLKDILPGTIEELGISEPLMRSAVFAAWRTIAASLPAHARAARPHPFSSAARWSMESPIFSRRSRTAHARATTHTRPKYARIGPTTREQTRTPRPRSAARTPHSNWNTAPTFTEGFAQSDRHGRG